MASADYLPVGRGASPEAALQEAVVRRGLGRSRCVGLLCQGEYSLLQVEPPPVPEDELKEAVRWQIADLIDYPIDDAVIDVFQVPNDGLRSRTRIAYVVSAHRSLVKRQADLLLGARLKLSAIDIPELALRNLASRLDGESRGLAFLFLDRTQGMITISRGANLFLSRKLSIGLDQLAEGAAELESSGEVDEDSLLVFPSRFNDLLDSIVLEIQRSLDFYESNYSLPPVSGLVVGGGAEGFSGVVSYLQRYLGVKVRPFDLSEVVDCQGIDPERQVRCLLAIGGALREMQVPS